MENKNIEIIDNMKFTDFSKYIDEDTGFLHINGVISRTGLQSYLGMELGDKENPMKQFSVYRSKDEVLKDESLKTFINAPITDNHPSEFVTVDNAKDLIKGSIADIETFNKDGIDYIKAKMTIQDKALINKVMNGKVEISAGYRQDLVKEKGEFNGIQYDYKQTDIKINHIAIVDKGRCEGECKLTADKKAIINTENKTKGKSMASILIDGVSHEVTDCVAKHLGGLNSKIKSLDEDMIKKEEEKKKAEDEAEKLKGEKEKMKEDMEEEKKKTSDSTLDALVSAKVALLDTASKLKVEVKSTDSVSDIKKSIIGANSKIDLTDKSEEFIDGVFETIVGSTVGKQEAIKDSHSKAFDGFKGTPQTGGKFANMAEEKL